MDRPAHRGDRVEVFQLHFRTQRILRALAQRDVHVAAELAFFHVGVGNVALLQDHLQRAEIREGLLGGLDVRLGNNLHQRRAGAVEIDQRGIAEVGGLGHVLLEVDAVEADLFSGIGDLFPVVGGVAVLVKRDLAAEAERQFHLRGLIVLRHVRIEVVLAVPLRDFRGRAMDHQSGDERLLDRRAVEHRQRAGQAEADRACVGVRLVAKRGAAGAEHLGGRFDLAVDFETDGDQIRHGRLDMDY